MPPTGAKQGWRIVNSIFICLVLGFAVFFSQRNILAENPVAAVFLMAFAALLPQPFSARAGEPRYSFWRIFLAASLFVLFYSLFFNKGYLIYEAFYVERRIIFFKWLFALGGCALLLLGISQLPPLRAWASSFKTFNRTALNAWLSKVLPWFALAVCAYVLIATAWVIDDAFITFRTVDNFLAGYGLRWNVLERVQVYTHPLWMVVLVVAGLVTRESPFTSMFLSFALTLGALYILFFRIAKSPLHVLACLIIVVFSKLFFDYSISGLENPLTHFLLAVFLMVYLDKEWNPRNTFWLSLLAALGCLNRLDTCLLFLPPLAYYFFHVLFKAREVKAIPALLAGFVPLLLWELFSLFYYGFFSPNSVYAKLYTGISWNYYFKLGFDYYNYTAALDPMILTVIFIGLTFFFFTREMKFAPFFLGVLLYLFYAFCIGDFMYGRFFTAPFFILVYLLFAAFSLSKRQAAYLGMMGLIIAALSPLPNILSDADYRTPNKQDARGYEYRFNGLLPKWFKSDWTFTGKTEALHYAALGKIGPYTGVAMGHLGFYSGPKVFILDKMALTDPLLARLPASLSWAPGHFARMIPPGYMDTIRTGKNCIQDKNLALYYDKLAFVTQGNLFSWQRIKEIVNLNSGAYDHFLSAYWPEKKR